MSSRLAAILTLTPIVMATASDVVRSEETSEPTCQDFSVRIELADVSFFDVGEDGVSAGDRRIGRYDVQSVSGRRLGEFLFVATVLPPAADGGHDLFAHGLYVLTAGTLATTLHYRLNDAAETDTGASQDFVYPITGGTGAFAGARGTLEAATDDEGHRVHAFTLVCPDGDVTARGQEE